MFDVREYLDSTGSSPYGDWFNRLYSQAAAKVATALIRLTAGNLSNVKGVGSGLFEYKIDFGPGYRIYFGKDGDRLVVLVGGGSKKRQNIRHRRCPDSLAGLQTKEAGEQRCL